jgi:D-glycerate 3-kinase
VLEENHQLNTVQLSLDDFYLTRAERKHLAGSVHPLLETRGVPGTHDVALAHATLDDLFSLSVNSYANLPRFDKAADDRASEADWDLVNQDIDVIILEGWCLGVPAQEDDELLESVNDLEKNEDADASWRTYVNNILRDDYQPLFERVDYLTVIQAPSFEVVYEWRSLQESKLMRKFAGAERTMDSEKLNRFIQHYERITRHCLKVLPHKANTVFVLDKDHQIIRRQDKKVS